MTAYGATCVGKSKETFPRLSGRFSPEASVSGHGVPTPTFWELGDACRPLHSDSWIHC